MATDRLVVLANSRCLRRRDASLIEVPTLSLISFDIISHLSEASI